MAEINPFWAALEATVAASGRREGDEDGEVLTPAEAAAHPDRTAQMTGYIEALGRYLQNG